MSPLIRGLLRGVGAKPHAEQCIPMQSFRKNRDWSAGRMSVWKSRWRWTDWNRIVSYMIAMNQQGCRRTLGLTNFEVNFQQASLLFLCYTTRSLSPLIAGCRTRGQAEPACLL